MEDFAQVDASGDSEPPSDDDDRALFGSLGKDVADQIIRVKHNNPDITQLEILAANERVCARLGRILGENKTLECFAFINCPTLGATALFKGLQKNRHIQKLMLFGCDLQRAGVMNNLAPFLSNNPCLIGISLMTCGLDQICMNLLSNALSNRAQDTLERLSLTDNRLGDVELDELVGTLNRSRSLSRLDLTRCGIGRQGCTVIARLLANQESNLTILDLRYNAIDNESAIMLSASLATNTKLFRLSLSGSQAITEQGWSAMLNLVCDISSIARAKASNHHLRDLGLNDNDREAIKSALGNDDANLLRASTELNIDPRKEMVARRKILWSHARGRINVADSAIATELMPRFLAAFGNAGDATDPDPVRYHEPPLPAAELEAVRLDAVYRIVRSQGDIQRLSGPPPGRSNAQGTAAEIEALNEGSE